MADIESLCRAMPTQAFSIDDVYQRAADGLPSWACDRDGGRYLLPVNRWLGNAHATVADTYADQTLVALCNGPTLDVGCGPGRLTGALAARGVPALGVDMSATAVRMTLARGAAAIRRDVFAPLPSTGRWDHIILADGNIGIGADPMRLLSRARDLICRRGHVVVEVADDDQHIRHQWLRFETATDVGDWFPWSRVGLVGLTVIAHRVGFELTSVVSVSGRVLAVLQNR